VGTLVEMAVEVVEQMVSIQVVTVAVAVAFLLSRRVRSQVLGRYMRVARMVVLVQAVTPVVEVAEAVAGLLESHRMRFGIRLLCLRLMDLVAVELALARQE
jgi:hypothetical protein